MADTIEDRACELAVYIIETGATVRTAAKHFGVSKSTVHKDLSQRLPQYNKRLYGQVRPILDKNKAGHSQKISASQGFLIVRLPNRLVGQSYLQIVSVLNRHFCQVLRPPSIAAVRICHDPLICVGYLFFLHGITPVPVCAQNRGLSR